MRKRWLFNFGLVLKLQVLLGCGVSFHSNQYEVISSMYEQLMNKDQKSLLVPNWLLSWSEYEILMVPVIVNNETWFVAETNSELIIKFDGWQITSVQNLLSHRTLSEVRKEESKLYFVVDDIVIKSVACSAWESRKSAEDLSVVFFQNCGAGDFEFRNMIRLDSNRNIVELSYVFHPGYPPMTMTINSDIS